MGNPESLWSSTDLLSLFQPCILDSALLSSSFLCEVILSIRLSLIQLISCSMSAAIQGKSLTVRAFPPHVTCHKYELFLPSSSDSHPFISFAISQSLSRMIFKLARRNQASFKSQNVLIKATAAIAWPSAPRQISQISGCLLHTPRLLYDSRLPSVAIITSSLMYVGRGDLPWKKKAKTII